MGTETYVTWLAIAPDQAPDWDAAARAARGLRLDRMLDTGDLYPWEGWWEDTVEDGALRAFVSLGQAQHELGRSAAEVAGAIEHGSPGEFIEVELPDRRLWLLASLGHEASDLFADLVYICSAGIARAAGFEHPDWNDTPWTELGSETPDSAMMFGVALAHTMADQVKSHAGVISIDPLAYYYYWTDQLTGVAQGGTLGGQALMRFAGYGLARCSSLRGLKRTADGEDLYEVARDLAVAYDAVADADPLWKSHADVFAALDQSVRELEPAFAALSQTDEIDERLAATVAAGPVRTALLGLVDLHRWGVADLMASDPEPIRAPHIRSRSDHPSLMHTGPWSVLAVDRFDWDAAARAASEIPAPYPQLNEDTTELRTVIDSNPWLRYSAVTSIRGLTVVVAHPHDLDEPDVALAIARLGSYGILTAGGAAWWSAPDVPTISQFFGIMVAMYPDAPDPPHFYARHAEGAATIDINTLEPITTTLGRRQLRFVLAWAELHQQELLANWQLVRSGKMPMELGQLK